MKLKVSGVKCNLLNCPHFYIGNIPVVGIMHYLILIIITDTVGNYVGCVPHISVFTIEWYTYSFVYSLTINT